MDEINEAWGPKGDLMVKLRATATEWLVTLTLFGPDLRYNPKWVPLEDVDLETLIRDLATAQQKLAVVGAAQVPATLKRAVAAEDATVGVAAVASPSDAWIELTGGYYTIRIETDEIDFWLDSLRQARKLGPQFVSTLASLPD